MGHVHTRTNKMTDKSVWKYEPITVILHHANTYT